MIKVNVLKTSNNIFKIEMIGHAGYDDFGKDIVCSAASTCLITTVNGIDLIDSNYLDVKEDKDKVLITILKNDEICNKLIHNMINILKELESQYPENIRVRDKED